MKLSELGKDYLRHLGAYKGYSPRTCECYELTYDQFVEYIRGQGLDDAVKNFNPDTIEGFARYLADKGLTANSINVKLSGLASLGLYGTRRRVDGDRGKFVLQENPVARVERPQKTRPDRKFLYKDELARLVAVECPANERVALDLFLDTGLRVSELARAKVRDLWQDSADRLVLSVTVKGRGRSEQKVHVPLGRDIADRLLAFLRHREAGPEDPLLVTQAGTPYKKSTLSEAVARVARRAGIDRIAVRPHALRHTYNVVARQAGVDALQRAALLNHTDTTTVQRYDHLLPDETAAARDVVRAGLRSYIGA